MGEGNVTIRSAVIVAAVIGIVCTPTKRVTMRTLHPADLQLPQDIRTLLLVDRTKFKSKAVNIIEGVLTGELPMEDRAAVQHGLNSIRTMLQTTDRFHVIIDPKQYTGNSLTSVFPQPMEWSRIDALCRLSTAQAVLAIEIFDTDFIVTDGKIRVKKKIKEGEAAREVEVDEFFAQGVMNLKMGIRLYDNVHREIVDEALYSRTKTWKSRAASKADAMAKLITKGDATRFLCGRIGENYAYKIAPIPIRITRTFYKKSGKAPAIERGTRFADVNKWEEAIRAWESGIAAAPEKQAGCLAYNIAVGYEVLGDYDKAIQWAQDAYTEYGNTLAQPYVAALRSRKESEQRVDEQMGEEQ
ncbi:MAG: tetratricopeptide repeat protein [Chitinispirillaceae bacterium]|nr:tetratricopeptide repeat protein [Chitinispirillaceae bacterium]